MSKVTVSGRLDGEDVEKVCDSPGIGLSAALTYANRVSIKKTPDTAVDEQAFYVRDSVTGEAFYRVVCEPDGSYQAVTLRKGT